MTLNYRETSEYFSDSPIIDAFGHLRVSNPTTLFDSQFEYNALPLLWETVLMAGGTATHLPNESAIRLRVTTVSGDKVTRQSRQYVRYQPGKSQFIVMTGVIGAAKANVSRCIGYFDDENGFYFHQNDTSIGVVHREFTSGAVVNHRFAQSDWNLDTMDGNGLSGITLDFTMSQLFTIDLEWLGVGRLRYGFNIAGKIVYCHEINHANDLTTSHTTTANLPLRYEITNTGTAASNSDLLQICQTVISEGGFSDERGQIGSASNGITAISVTTRRPVLSIRPKATFNSIVNRAEVIPLGVSVFTGGQNVFWELVYDGTLTGASYASTNANSIVERDIAATAIAGGLVVASGFVAAGGAGGKGGGESANITSKLLLGSNIAGDVFTPLSLVATAFTSTATVHGELSWKELY